MMNDELICNNATFVSAKKRIGAALLNRVFGLGFSLVIHQSSFILGW